MLHTFGDDEALAEPISNSLQPDAGGWMEAFLKTGKCGLKARAEDEQAAHVQELQELRAK